MRLVAGVMGLCLSAWLVTACGGGGPDGAANAHDPTSGENQLVPRDPKPGANGAGASANVAPAPVSEGVSGEIVNDLLRRMPLLNPSYRDPSTDAPSFGVPNVGPPADVPADIVDHFAHPSGALTAANSAGIMASLMPVAAFETAVGGLVFATPSACPAQQAGALSGTCACPGGGSYSYAITRTQEPDVIDADASWQFASCVSGTATYDGALTAYVQATPDGSQMVGDQFMTFAATSTTGSVTTKIDAAIKESGVTKDIAVPLDGGWVVLRVDAPPRLYILDRAGQWTCDGATIATTCTLDGSIPVQSLTL
jgi:hypothetical protein